MTRKIDFKFREGTIISPGHIKKGMPNQDYSSYFHDIEKTIMIVADGAGSLKNSEKGSQYIVEYAMGRIMDEDLSFVDNQETLCLYLQEIFEDFKRQMSNLDKKEYGDATLAVFLAKEDFWAAGTIGDAFCIVKDSDNLEIVTSDNNEYANVTSFLRSENAVVNSISGKTENIEYVAVSSDGLAHSSIENSTGKPSRNFWEGFYRTVSNSEDENVIPRFFEWMNSKNMIDDDTTIVFGYKID